MHTGKKFDNKNLLKTEIECLKMNKKKVNIIWKLDFWKSIRESNF